MKNLRISSLDADRPVADKDCQVCCRRRIRCDRTVPSCKKCEFRGLSCSGYAPKLRWSYGLTSRGRHAGRPYQASSSRRAITDWPSELQPGFVQTSSMSPEPTRSLTDLSVDSDQSLDEYTMQQLYQTPSPDIQTWLNNDVWSNENLALIQHFDHNVAGILVWVDSSENRWRRCVLPLASSSPMLLYAILYFAAAHLSNNPIGFGYDFPDPSQLAARYRGDSLKCLNEELQDELRVSKTDETKDLSRIHQRLATMLVLCYAEMLPRNSDVWKIHLRACQATVKDTISMLNRPVELDETMRFLIKEVHDLEILASISSFSQAPGQGSVRPVPSISNVYWPILDIIHDITITERLHHSIVTKGGLAPEVNVEFWQGRLTEASTQTKDAFHTKFSPSEELSTQFACIVKAHHLACLIYFFRAIPHATGPYPSSIGKLIEALYDTLHLSLERKIHHVFKNVFIWPLFIFGTECRHDQDRQRFVHDFFLQVMAQSGFWCSHSALEFLRSFWASELQLNSTWIQFARSNLREEDSFLLY